MRPVHLLLILFLTVPVVEIYVLIKVGGVMGAIPTVFLVVFTAVLGALLLQAQGSRTLRRAQASLDAGELPALEILEGVVLLVSGALLLTPGFVTDVLGFLGLVPALRRRLVQRFVERSRLGRGGEHQDRPGHGPRTIEGEYWRDDR